jgi:glycosyl-4,4'-diaponeurosporenoate acyltransferase
MIIQLPGSLNILINFVTWLILHVTISLSIDRIQPNYFNSQKWLYRKRGWEKDGKIYQSLFIIRKWKGYLPDGARVSRNRFRKKLFGNPDPTYLRRFIQETCRAELIHWVIFAFSVIFFIWNRWWIWMILIAYSSVVNIPCIIAQRYNRIRLQKILGEHFKS